MTQRPDTRAPGAETTTTRPAGGWTSGRWLVLAGATVAFASRLLVNRATTGPEIAPDEFAYLAMARLMAGVGETWNLGDVGGYSIGYSVLIAPLFRIFDDPDSVFRAILVLNALLGAALVWAYEAIARRVTVLERPATVVAATLAACLPGLVVTSHHGWSDNLAPLAFALVVLAGLRLCDRPTPARATTLAVAAAASYAVHGRFVASVAVATLLIAVMAIRRRLRPATALASAGLGLILTALVQLATGRIHERLYIDGDTQSRADGVADRFGIPDLFFSVIGQAWFQLVVTAGLAGLGAIALGRTVMRSAAPDGSGLSGTDRSTDRVPGARWGTRTDLPPDAVRFLAASVVGLFAVSAIFMAGADRADHLVYGRYNDAFIGVLVIIGIAAASTARPARRNLLVLAAIVLAIIGSGIVLSGLRGDVLDGPRNSVGMLGLIAITRGGTADFAAATAIGACSALIVCGSAMAATRRRGAVILIVAALLVPVGIIRADRRYPRFDDGHAASIEEVAGVLGDGATLGVSSREVGTDEFHAFYAKQFHLPQVRFEPVGAEDPFSAGYDWVLAAATASDGLASGYRVVWADPFSTDALWVAPGPVQDDLAAGGRLFEGLPVEPSHLDDEVAVDAAGLRFEGGRLRGTARIERAGAGPWLTSVDKHGLDPAGRVRLRVSLWEAGCDCIEDQRYVELPVRFVPAEQDHVDVEVDLEFGDLSQGHAFQVGMERAGGDWLGHITDLPIG